MSEVQEKVWVVMRRTFGTQLSSPVKSADDRADARGYAKRMNLKSRKYVYTVKGVKKL